MFQVESNTANQQNGNSHALLSTWQKMRSHTTAAASTEAFAHFLRPAWHTPCRSCCLSPAISAPRKQGLRGAKDWFLC